MSYQERRTIVSLFAGIAVIVAYCIYAVGQWNAADGSDLKFWAGTVLVFIGIGVAVTIIIQIVFHILMAIEIAVKKKIRNEQIDDKEMNKSIEAEMVEDEMDKLIGLKSMQVGFGFAGVGFVAALIAVVLGSSAAVMLNIIFLSFGVGSVVEGGVQLFLYRKGVAHA